MKNPKVKINPSQRERARMFQKTEGPFAKKQSVADGRKFIFGRTVLRFSEAVAHGPEEAFLGWVVMASIRYDDECFMHAPDVQGPISTRATEIILAEKPNVLMVGGPPFYLSGFKVDEGQIQKALLNLTKIVESVPLTILEHHALRDAQWRVRVESILNAAHQSGHLLITGAEYAGVKDVLLESRRRELYAEFPPSEEFEKWTKVASKKLSHIKPPIE
jgi:uncharacterized protein